MPDFDKLRKENQSAVLSQHEFAGYIKWRDEQVCMHCGKKFGEKQEGEIWVTEIECWDCFYKKCEKIEKSGG